MTLFDVHAWEDKIAESIKERVDADILWGLIDMKIDPDLEAFFVAIALEHGTHPQPKFGVERTLLAQEITVLLSNHTGAPDVIQKVRRNYRELGGRLLDTDPQWFYSKLADSYLDWLYSQEESQRLMPDALQQIEKDKQTLREERSPIRKGGPRHRIFWKL